MSTRWYRTRTERGIDIAAFVLVTIPAFVTLSGICWGIHLLGKVTGRHQDDDGFTVLPL